MSEICNEVIIVLICLLDIYSKTVDKRGLYIPVTMTKYTTHHLKLTYVFNTYLFTSRRCTTIEGEYY